MRELGTLIGGLAISRMQELSAMVDYPAEWRRLAQEFYDIPDPQENLRAFKKDGRWQLHGGISAEHDRARIWYRYTSLAERAAALAGTKTGSLEEWLELLATKGPPHETRRGGADAPRMAGFVLHPHIPAIERLSIVSSDFCKHLEAVAFAEAVRIAQKSEESAPSGLATVANAEAQPANDPQPATGGTRSSRKRGPKPDLETASRVAEIVERVAPDGDWRSKLDDICDALDEEKIPFPAKWRRDRHCRCWADCLNEPPIVTKVIEYRLKVAGRKNSL